MAKPLKILLLSLGGLLGVLLLALIAASLLFDPNDYRGQIADVVRKETGRELQVGDIQLRIFPWLRVAVHEATLSNAQGFDATPFAQIKELSVGVKLLPLLLHRQIEVSTLTLDGLRLSLAVDAQGRSNWQDILDIQANKPRTEDATAESSAGFDAGSLHVSGVTIRNTAVRYADARNDAVHTLEDVSLETGALRSGQPFDLKAALKAQSSSPAVAADLKLSGTVTPQLDAQRLSVDKLTLDVSGKGFDLDLAGTLKATLTADLAQQQYRFDGLTLDLDASGKTLPGGKQKLALTGTLDYDGQQGSLKLDGAQLKALGLTVQTTISGSGLNTDAPRLSGPVTVQPFKPRDLLAQLDIKPQTADPVALEQASLSAQYSGSFSDARLERIALILDQSKAGGHLHIRDFSTMALDFALAIDAIDADRYLPPKAESGADQAPAGKKDESINDIEIPTEALEKLNANGTLDVGKLTINGLKLSDVRLKLSGSGSGAPRQQDLSAQLYGGKVRLSNRVTPGKTPAYALKTQLSALRFEPFLKDLLDKDMISGLGNLSLDVSSRGRTVGEIRKALNGEVGLRIENGAVKGFNLGEILRKGEAMLAGNLNYTDSAPKETDFAAISVSGRIVNGILSTDDLNAASPAFRVSGAGRIDLVNETLDYLAKPTVVESSRGQGGRSLEDLKGLTIPIKLTGSWHAPKYKLDIEDALKQKAKDKIREELKGREDEIKEKLNEKLGDFLFGRQKKKEAPVAPGT